MVRDWTILTCMMTLLIATATPLHARQDESEEEGEHFYRHRLSFGTGIALIPRGLSAGAEDFIIAPSVALDYGFQVTRQFGVAIKDELELSSYIIETKEGAPLEREFAYVGVIVATAEVARGFGLFAGPGVELERNENFFVVKLGVDYMFIETERWNAGVGGAYEFKAAYGTFNVGTGFTWKC